MNKFNLNILSLVKQLKADDELAFDKLFNIYYDPIFSYINSYANDSALTQDVVQDTFIKLWNLRHNLDLSKPIAGFLYRVAYNTFIDYCRKNKQEYAMLVTLTHKKEQELAESHEDVKEARIKQIMLAIDKLPPRCKAVFKMSKIQGLKYAEIAEILSISVKTVDAQMAKAYIIIRKAVKKTNIFLLFINTFKRKLFYRV